jgi:hypothetical protein
MIEHDKNLSLETRGLAVINKVTLRKKFGYFSKNL